MKNLDLVCLKSILYCRKVFAPNFHLAPIYYFIIAI